MHSRIIAALLLSVVATLASAEHITCKVVGVSDGDTFTCLTDAKKQVKVRMAEIDTPESKQPYGSKSKQALSDMVFGREVSVHVQETDRYGRSVGRVHVGDVDVNAQLVSQGAAWVYRQYNKDKALLMLEDQSRKAKRGLWALPESERIPPWEWRRAARDQRQEKREASSVPVTEKRPAPVVASSSSSGFSCSTRKTCGQMSNCAEAEFHLTECGNGRLDRDNDGVPCESLCK
ncbi:thermonuclease family protein [Azorhizophilus paspali]|uniref:Thermonuclease family protein n=1 Tax=Azorhizophilus paspali TaxID=69963 RepID=A0ABV6SH35_AZOPA